MTPVDFVIFAIYILIDILISVLLSRKINNSTDFFVAGHQSSWWLSGLSAFMTMFSAGTFVVWGGIAYRYGMVAVSISMCPGISALAVGYFLAAKWRKLRISSAAEFILKRIHYTSSGESCLN